MVLARIALMRITALFRLEIQITVKLALTECRKTQHDENEC